MGDNDDRAPLPDELSSTTDAMRRSPMCVKCSSALMMCECTGGQAHGEDVAFMCSDPLPADATMRQHLGRFVALVEAHPMMQGQIQIRQFVNDYLAKGLEQTLRVRAATTPVRTRPLSPRCRRTSLTSVSFAGEKITGARDGGGVSGARFV